MARSWWIWGMLVGSTGCSLLADAALDDDGAASAGSGGSLASSSTNAGAAGGVPSGAGADNSGGGGAGPGSSSATGVGGVGGVGGAQGAGGVGGAIEPCGGCEPGFVCEGTTCLCQAPIAPAASACPQPCTSCDQANGLCIIERTAEKKKEVIQCPDGMACRIECNGDKACEEAKLHCPVDQACEVVCAATESCKKAQIFGADGGVTLQCTGMKGCQEGELKCGEGACAHPCPTGMDGPLIVTCGGSCDCLGC
ncbi:MAG: hypothetical protein WKG00_13675 [Polyangiaceae bacterium]